MPDYMLGIDIGTSACKAAAFDRFGNAVATGTASYSSYYPKAGYVEQKPGDWWDAVCKAINDIFQSGKVEPTDIKSAGIDGHSWAAVLIDKAGEVLFDNPMWMDTRAADICEEVKKTVGEKAILELCGNLFAPTFTTPKLMWFGRNHPETYKKTHKALQSNSYIIYRLTGKFSQDISQCYGLHFFDMRKNAWEKEMAKTLGINIDIMPNICESHEIVGHITKEAAGKTGLLEGTPVVAGGVDSACGTLGAGVTKIGETQEQGGQSGGMSICLEQFQTHEKLIMCRHVVPGKYLLQGGTVGGGASFKWLRENFFLELGFSEMDELASKISPGSDGVIFLPYMAGERSPIWNPKAKGVFYGFDFSKNRAHFIRAALEGVAYSLLHNLETAKETVGDTVGTLYSNGGSANSDLWMQIKSDVTNKPVAVTSSDMATTLGAALLGGVAIGLYDNFEEAAKNTIHIKKTFYPSTKNHEIYQKSYETYLEIYANLKKTMGNPM